MNTDGLAAPGGTFDMPSWAANWTVVNMSRLYVPSAKDLALAGPRVFMKLGSFLQVPETVDNIFGIRMGNRMIAEATDAGIVNPMTTAAAVVDATRGFVQAGTEILVEADEAVPGSSRFTMQSARSLGSVFSYATSKWALCCILMAVVLNRTQIYGSTRRNLNLKWKIRLAIRIIPIILLAVQARWLLQSIQCQTSPDFSMLRWGNASKSSDLMFTQNGGLLHTLSSSLLLGASDEYSCVAVHMIQPEEYEGEGEGAEDTPILDLSGSLSLLWPLFKTLSASSFVEAISCAVEGRQVGIETGMTLFEHSLAFAEAESVVGQQIGWGSFGGTKVAKVSNSTDEGTQIAITRAMIMKRVNTSPEMLLTAFLSAMNHITSHILAIFNIQGRLRLLNTGLWALMFMSFIVWSVVEFSIDDISNAALLRFPTVCIVGIIPHILVLCGIISCSFIYSTALVLSALASPDTSETTLEPQLDDAPQVPSAFFQRLKTAHNNMQANVPLSGIRVTMHMDFYTALLRVGFSVMTMASEAVYLNESREVTIKQRTWLEEERLREIETAGVTWLGPSFRAHDEDSNFNDGMADNVGLVSAKDQPISLLERSSSGYAREMIAQKSNKVKSDRAIRDGVGAAERSGRWILAFEFFLGIHRLMLSWSAHCALVLLAKAGITYRPRWLLWLVRRPKTPPADPATRDSHDSNSLNFWMLNIDGELTLPKDEHVDVEAEMRRRMRNETAWWDGTEEKDLDKNLYHWWLTGGWWGVDDSSGNFKPSRREVDEDTTSVVSFASSVDGWESDSENDDGRRTPTQQSPQFSREGTPFVDTPLNPSELAKLLNPKTPEQRSEAHALAAHFANDQIMTRSRYKEHAQRERSRVLTSSLHRPANFTPSNPLGKLTLDEEAHILEYLIMTRRGLQGRYPNYPSIHAVIVLTDHTDGSTGQPKSWAKGASGMGEGGPQCVVCQSSPRSIIVWPCRCLSLCDDCRVTLAMNNFDKCVCCRRDVASFSRIFVP